MTESTLIRWIDGKAPLKISGGTTWGMPFARGSVPAAEALAVTDSGGATVPSQAWPLATWPDGSLKWAGIALPATDTPSGTYQVKYDAGALPREAGAPPSGSTAISVTDNGNALTVDTGALQMVISRSGSTLFSSLARNGTEVARDARLVSLFQDGVPERGGSIPAGS